MIIESIYFKTVRYFVYNRDGLPSKGIDDALTVTMMRLMMMMLYAMRNIDMTAHWRRFYITPPEHCELIRI